MEDYNKQNLILFGILAAVGFTIFGWVIVITSLNGNAWALPFPLLATGYGVYKFIKKYLPLTGKPNNKK